MRAATAAAVVVGAFAQATIAAPSVQAKNVIYIVPDGYGQASQSMARHLHSLLKNGGDGGAPVIEELAADDLVRGKLSFPFA